MTLPHMVTTHQTEKKVGAFDRADAEREELTFNAEREAQMSQSEKFVRLAAECGLMAQVTHTPESKIVWIRMAERWLRCAELYDREASPPRRDNLAKRHWTPAHSLLIREFTSRILEDLRMGGAR